jgi:glycosyltransferase involved in cell wall biosynthesis
MSGTVNIRGMSESKKSRNRHRAPLHERRPEGEVHRLKPWPLVGRKLDAALSFPAFFNPRWYSAIMKTARATRADVILVRDLPLAPTAIRVGRRLAIPVVLDMAENYPAMMRSLWETGVHRRTDWLVRNPRFVEAVERYVLSRLDHVLVVVEESRDRLLSLGVAPERVAVVGNTPPAARLTEFPPRSTRDSDALEVIYLGLLEAPRGIGNLIDAVASARGAGHDVRLTLIGSGREQSAFEARARDSGGGDAIRFLGRVPNAEALRLLATADVGVVPHLANESWNTTIPNKLFDYMAAGLAVVTSSARPAARVVRETGAGLVYEDTSVPELAAALVWLTDASLRSQCGDRGRAAIAARFNWEQDASRLVGSLERVVGHSG